MQIDLFSQAILKDQKWEVDGTEGLRDHLVMEAIFESIATGQAQKVGKAVSYTHLTLPTNREV